MEKHSLVSEYTANQDAINGYNTELKDLKEELANMKNVIAHTFEEELRSAAHTSIISQSKVSKKY